MARKIDFKKRTLRVKTSSRGGGIEIHLDGLKGIPSGQKMAAYQNYLGGGMLGAVAVNDTLRRESYRDRYSDEVNEKLDEIGDQLKRYFFNLTNPEPEYPDGEKCWESQTYEENQRMSVSAY